MKQLGLVAVVACSIALCAPVFAIDRDVAMIDSAEVFYRDYDQFSAPGVLLHNELKLPTSLDISLLVDLGWGYAQIPGEDEYLYSASLGLRKYLTALCSASLAAEIEWIDDAADFAVGGARLGLDVRLAPPECSVSPFVGLAAAYHAGRSTPWFLPSDNFSAAIVQCGAGVDISLDDLVSLTARGQFTESLGLDGGDYAKCSDGWAAFLGMKYYWR